jgi:predicted dehydrogenase
MGSSWESAWRLVGEKGTVLWDGAHGFQAQVVTGGTGFCRDLQTAAVAYNRDDPRLKGHAGCLDEMLASLRQGRAPQTVCTDNIKSLAMVHAAIKSAATGRKVKCG